MPKNVRHYLHIALLVVTPVLSIVGVVALWAAISFEGYVAGLMMLTLAACSFLAARELKPSSSAEKGEQAQAMVNV